jgi:hypothetical protein
MSLTFSLRRLLVGVTVVCVICALVANFPKAAFAVVLAVPFFLPTVVVCATLPWFSLRPRGALATALAGAIIGWLLTPTLYVNWGTSVPEWWDLYSLDLQTQAWPPALGAFVLGFAWVMFFPRWKEGVIRW